MSDFQKAVPVARRMGVVPKTLRKWNLDPTNDFPKGIRLSGHLYWDVAAIDEWVAEHRALAKKAVA
ncbi:helix-turn-helix transcriptional regulator [Methylocella sp.]|jgi:predicted DNA-binding transcriptional regulator AlpA|uniref:helix-turn-helix transcriptional regulator n=1 Tax=Methylocella sp. TaxID=1978226 RepID=UPI003C19985E